MNLYVHIQWPATPPAWLIPTLEAIARIEPIVSDINTASQAALTDVERLLADTADKQAQAIKDAVAAQQATDAAAQTSAEQSAINTMQAINAAVDSFDPPAPPPPPAA